MTTQYIGARTIAKIKISPIINIILCDLRILIEN